MSRSGSDLKKKLPNKLNLEYQICGDTSSMRFLRQVMRCMGRRGGGGVMETHGGGMNRRRRQFQ